ncbi:MAG: Mth938-like domain-containing protein [Gammaproteobacteria bacterium]
MEIQLETVEPHTILSYNEHSILVGQTTLSQSCVLSKQAIVTDWPIHHIDELNWDHMKVLLEYKPEVIIIGHAAGPRALLSFASELSSQKIGIECMNIAAACRTYNVLLSEQRNVVLGIIW